MTFQAMLTLGVIVAVFAGLQLRSSATDLVFMAALAFVTLAGIISPEQALSGFANPAVVMVGAMLVIGTGMRSTGALDWVGHQLLGKAQTDRAAVWRLTIWVTTLSAFVNNTTLVAMLVPVLIHWCRRTNVSPSKLMIPLSYLAVLGGLCTLIGTSTNVTVNGLLTAESRKATHDEATREQLRPMTFLEIGYAGIPCAVIGGLYLALVGRRMLPNRTELLEKLGDERREYLVEMTVQQECRMIGRSVQEAGLRQLPGLFLIEIDRGGDLIAPVSPDDVLHCGDRLIFTGVVSTIIDLEKIPGLVPAADITYEVSPHQRSRRHLTEAVLSTSSPLVGQTIKEANFRQLYNAAVVAVHRNGQRVTTKIGDIELQPGDTLLLQTRQHFAEAFRNHPDFFLVSSVEGSEHGRHDKAWLAFTLLGLLVLLLSLGSLLVAVLGPLDHTMLAPVGKLLNSTAFLAIAPIMVGVLMVVTRCLTISEARSSINLEILLTIAAGVGLGQAMENSGLAKVIAGWLMSVPTWLPEISPMATAYLLLVLIHVSTLFVTELLSNNAAATLMFPLGVALAAQAGVSPRPFIMSICIAASASFITPIGYQTNLMVMGPGGYKPSDFARVGIPLTIVVTIVALVVIPIAWPF